MCSSNMNIFEGPVSIKYLEKEEKMLNKNVCNLKRSEQVPFGMSSEAITREN